MHTKGIVMKQGSTLFLRAVVIAMGILVFTLCIFVLPGIHNGWAKEYPDAMYMKYPFMLGIVATAIPFFVVLYQTLKLLGFIDKNTAFSNLSVHALKIIMHCAVLIGIVYAAMMPIFYYVAEKEDAPGLIVIGMVFTCAPIVVAVFAAVLQRVLQSAIAIKKENDLTV